jgi:hypothetical protein
MRGRAHRCVSIKERVLALFLLASFLLYPVQPVFAAFPDGTPTIPNASVFTQTSEAQHVDGASGAFTQNIPLHIPPGRNGLQPALSLDYKSQRTQDGIVGFGWNISLPYIQRLNKTGSQNLYSTSGYFTSSFDGELASDSTSSLGVAPSIVDSLPITSHVAANTTSDAFSYTVPSGGINKLFVVMVCKNDGQ